MITIQQGSSIAISGFLKDKDTGNIIDIQNKRVVIDIVKGCTVIYRMSNSGKYDIPLAVGADNSIAAMVDIKRSSQLKGLYEITAKIINDQSSIVSENVIELFVKSNPTGGLL